MHAGDRYLTVRYAGASGDFNPIHLDDEFARSVGLPGPHPARAVDDGAGGARADRGGRRPARAQPARRSSSAAWACPEQEIASPRRSREADGGATIVDVEAAQDGRRLIRRGRPSCTWANPAGPRIERVLTPRQELLLGKVVDGFAATGQPVGSKALAADPDVDCRALDDPQRARGARGARAARAPAHLGGARADRRRLPLLRRPRCCRRAPRGRGRRSSCRSCGARSTRRCGSRPRRSRRSRTCWRSSPRRRSTRRRSATSRSCALQPQVLMVVVITSTGGVSKRVFTFDRPVDPGLADWAGVVPQRAARRHGRSARGCCTRGSTTRRCTPTERAFVAELAPAFTELAETAEDTLYVDGARAAAVRVPLPGRLAAQRADGDARAARVAARRALRALDERDVYVRIGGENAEPALRSLSLVAANYGLPQRNLGTVSVIGPTRMDYAGAIRSVREAALQLSRFVEDVYDELLMPRDYYEVLGVDRGADDGDDQEGVPAARARAAPGRQRARPRGRGEVQGGRRGLRGALRPRAPAALRRLRPRRAARAAATRPTSRASARSRTSSRRSSAPAGSTRRSAARGARGGACRAATWSSRSRSTSSRPPTARSVEVTYDARGARATTCHGNGAEPGTPIVTCPRCQGAGQLQAVARTRFGQIVRTAVCDVCGGDGRIARAAVRRLRRARAWSSSSGACGSTSRPASTTASASASPAAATPASAAGPPGDLYVVVRVREDERFLRDGEDLVTVVDVAGAAGGARHDGRRCRRSTATCRVEIPAGTQPGETITLRGRGLPPLVARPHRRPARGRQRRDPAPADARAARAARATSPATLTDDNLRVGRGHAREAQARARRVIRLAGARPRAPRPRSCSRSCSSSSPAALEERDAGRTRSSTRSTARRASSRTCRRAARRRPATRWSRCRPPRCPTTGPSAGRRGTGRSTSPGASGGCGCGRRGSRRWPEDGIDLVIDPGQAFGDRRAPHDAAVPRAAARARARRARWPTGARAAACWRSRPRGSASRRCWPSTTSRRARGGARERRANGADVAVRRVNLRREPAPVGADRAAPTSCARCCSTWRGCSSARRSASSPRGCCARRPTRSRRRSPHGLLEKDRRFGGEWAAVLLER